MNTDIYLTRTDKGVGVILNCSDYISKMSVILIDSSEFHLLGDLSFDDTFLKMKI